MPLASLAILAVVILSIRGTLGHRPMNPSSVAYSSDGMLNTLALNSLYNVFYAVYSMKNENPRRPSTATWTKPRCMNACSGRRACPSRPPTPTIPACTRNPRPARRSVRSTW